MRLNDKRGMVLVTGLLVLALLTLLGTGSLYMATLDTKVVTNQKGSKQAFYAAEAALAIAVGELVDDFRDGATDPISGSHIYAPDPAKTPIPISTGAGHIIDGADFNGFELSYLVEMVPYLLPQNDFPPPTGYHPTQENLQRMSNIGYPYIVRGNAEAINSNDQESVSETVFVLERPLTQYFAYYVGDMNIRPQSVAKTTLAGGRLFATRDIYFAPSKGLTIDDKNQWSGNGSSPNSVTAGGEIYYLEQMTENGSTAPGGSGPVELIITTGGTPDIKTFTQHIENDTRASGEKPFLAGVDADEPRVAIGVDPLIITKYNHGAIEPGGHYQTLAENPVIPDPTFAPIDTLLIRILGGALLIELRINGSLLPIDVTPDIATYSDDNGLIDFNEPGYEWDPRVLENAAGTQDSNGDRPVNGTIVYCPEAQPTTDDDGNPGYPASTSLKSEINPFYPSILQRQDPREGDDVDFTVIDLQRLHRWYQSYLVSTNTITADKPITIRKLFIYATRPDFGGTGAGLQAIKLIGSNGGRFNPDPALGLGSGSQSAPTVLCPTTVVSDRPIYIHGDFNSSFGIPPAGGNPSGKVAVIADAVTALSNNWNSQNHGGTGGALATTPASDTSFDAAFFTGRFNYNAGGSGPAEGLEDLVRYIEDWSGFTTTIIGSLSSPWYSQLANSEFQHNNPGVFTPPDTYNLGWDVGLSSIADTPPYVPTAFMLERRSWQEQ